MLQNKFSQNKFKPEEPEFKKVKRSLKYSVVDGSFFNVMDGFTTSFITPYALFLNASNFIISLLVSLPDLFASFFQLSAIKANEIFRSRKLLIVISALLQALVWLPILLIPYIVPESKQGLLLVLFVILTTMLSSFLSPLWRGFMGDLVPEHERGSFFSKRNKIAAAVCFVSTFAAGGILQHYSVINPLRGFVILFLVAFIARIFSSLFLSLMYEKKSSSHSSAFSSVYRNAAYKKNSVTLLKFLKTLTKSDYGLFVLFICLFRISVSIASPFFAVYELKYLHFSYLQFTIMTAMEIMASFAFLGLWGKLNDEKGSRLVLIISGILIPFVPLLYLFSANYFFLLGVSLLSGAAWAGFNLALGNFMFDASTPENRVKYVAYFNLLHGLSVFIGATGGGLLLRLLSEGVASIKTLFLISGLARLAVAVFLFPMMREMRVVQVRFDRNLFNYSLFIKPRQGFVEDPFDYYMAFEKKSSIPRPKLYVDKQFLDDDDYVDPDKKRVHEEVLYKNFLQPVVDNMKKKKQ